MLPRPAANREHLDRLGAPAQRAADRAVLLVHPVRHRGEHVGRLVVAGRQLDVVRLRDGPEVELVDFVGGDPALRSHQRLALLQLRSAFTATSLAEGRAIATTVLESFPTCPVAEIARLGRTLRAWKKQFLAYFTTSRASNGGTAAINGIIELHRRVARGFRNPRNYRLRMILAAGRLTHSNLHEPVF